MRDSSKEILPELDGVSHSEVVSFISKYKQVNLLREIENRFSMASYLKDSNKNSIQAPKVG